MPNQQFKVDFSFRFDRDEDENERKVALRRKLAEQFANDYHLASGLIVKELEFYPVERAGKSGSEVFYLNLHVDDTASYRRFIAKFQDEEKTKKETRSAYLANHAQICRTYVTSVIESADDKNDSYGMIVCDLVRFRKFLEFRGCVVGDRSRDIDAYKITDQECALALQNIFMITGRVSSDGKTKDGFYKDFERYIHRKSNPLSILQSRCEGAEPDGDDLVNLARNVLDAHEKIKERFQAEKVYTRLVHGDLHARNLMVNLENTSEVEIIDFDWVDEGHPAKDYVLMEATLKYMLLNELMGKETRGGSSHFPVSKFLQFELYLIEQGMDLSDDSFKEFLSKNSIDKPHEKALKRIFLCLCEIRKAASSMLNEYCNKYDNELADQTKHYYVCLFLVTIGLYGMNEMESFWTLYGLDAIGGYLCKNIN